MGTRNSKLHLEQKANTAVTVLTKWCKQHKLQLSDTKSAMLLVKGSLNIRRPPSVEIGNRSLRMPSAVHYLGVHFGARFNITPHVQYLNQKSKITFNKFSQTAKKHWGLHYKSMSILYKGIFEHIIAYAAAEWSDKINAWHVKTLKQTQRYVYEEKRRSRTTSSPKATKN